MAYLNANIPATYAQIRREYLYDGKKHHGEVEDCIIFGVTCLTGQRYFVSCDYGEWGCLLSSPDISLYSKGFRPEDVPKRRLDELELWNSFSYYPAITCWDILTGTSGKYIGKDKKWHTGKYLFTIDFAHPDSNILTLNTLKYRTNTNAHI